MLKRKAALAMAEWRLTPTQMMRQFGLSYSEVYYIKRLVKTERGLRHLFLDSGPREKKGISLE